MIIKDTLSVYTDELIKYLKKTDKRISVDLLTCNKKKDCTPGDHYFFIKNTKYKNKIIMKIQKFTQYNQIVKRLSCYDVINFHYVNPNFNFLIKKLKNKTQLLVTTVWGSDFYKASKINRFRQKKIYKYSDVITFGNPKTINNFNFYFKKKYSNKLRLCNFGLTPLNYIKDINEKKYNSSFDFSKEKIKVTIGYNSKKYAQHLEVIKQIRSYKKLKDDIQIILPLTYGDKEYLKYLEKTIQSEYNDMDIVLLKNFLSFQEIAQLRKQTDIMINVQTTDQLSGSMQETIYAGNIVINGSWLPYEYFKEKGIYFEEVNTIEEIPRKLEYIIDNFVSLKEKCKKNSELIWGLSSWEHCIKRWINIYNEYQQVKLR